MRKYIIGFLIFAILVILAQNIYHYVKNRGNTNNTTNSPYQFVDEAFGPITYPTIPSLAVANGSNPSYSVSGQFATSPTSVNVYKVTQPKVTLSSVTTGINMATQLGIESDYQTNGDTLTWQTNSKQTLIYNKLTQAVDYNNLGIDLNILRANKPDTIDIKNIESSIDSALNSINQDNNTNITQTTYSESPKISFLLASGKIYQTTTNTENSDYIRKDYYPQYEVVSLKSTNLATAGTGSSTGNLTGGLTGGLTGSGSTSSSTLTSDVQPINARLFLDNPDEGTTNLTFANSTQVLSQLQLSKFTGSSDNSKVREFHQLNIQVSKTDIATYTLEPIEQAWEDVKDGKGSLRYLVKQGSDPLSDYKPLNVKRFILNPDKCELGFYTTKTWTGYIYPIYVLRGTAELQDGTTADFVFYTKAIVASK